MYLATHCSDNVSYATHPERNGLLLQNSKGGAHDRSRTPSALDPYLAASRRSVEDPLMEKSNPGGTRQEIIHTAVAIATRKPYLSAIIVFATDGLVLPSENVALPNSRQQAAAVVLPKVRRPPPLIEAGRYSRSNHLYNSELIYFLACLQSTHKQRGPDLVSGLGKS